jgi:hypothetical protein
VDGSAPGCIGFIRPQAIRKTGCGLRIRVGEQYEPIMGAEVEGLAFLLDIVGDPEGPDGGYAGPVAPRA